MAYPNGMGPIGLVPQNLIGGQVYSGAIRQIPIASGYAQNIGYGDFVAYKNDGTLVRVDTTSGAKSAFSTNSSTNSAPVGIFLGCSYVSATGMKYFTQTQYWPSGQTVQADTENYGYGWAYVCEDPDAVFVATVSNAGTLYTTTGGATQASVGLNAGYYVGSGLVNTTTGNSLVTVDLNNTGTGSLPLRIVDLVRDKPTTDGSGYQQVLVSFNSGTHFYRQATGI